VKKGGSNADLFGNGKVKKIKQYNSKTVLEMGMKRNLDKNVYYISWLRAFFKARSFHRENQKTKQKSTYNETMQHRHMIHKTS
jgi:hypothetical protein